MLIFASVILCVFVLLLGGNDSGSGKVCLKKGFCFLVEVAQTPSERAKGLMFRENMERDRGMLFIFPLESRYAFWMKNTLIPLDIIWINSAKEVVSIAEDVRPCVEEECETFTPEAAASYVLEVNAGMAAEKDIKVGDRLDF